MATKRPGTTVAVLRTTSGHVLTIRANPSAAAGKRFAAEQERRLGAGEPAGHHDRMGSPGESVPAYAIIDAAFFPEESANEDYDWSEGTPIAL